MTRALRFLTESVFSLQDGRLFGSHLQLDGVIFGPGFQMKIVSEIQFPIVNPGQSLTVREAASP